MTSPAGTFQRVTVAEAAAILGISPATVRRKLKAGELTGERVIRPQGSAFVVIAAELGEARQTIERQAERLEAQAETIGRQGAELAASQAEVTRVTAERDAAELSRRRDNRRLSIALTVLAALAVAATLAPAWVR